MVGLSLKFSAIAALSFSLFAEAAPHASLSQRGDVVPGKTDYTIQEIQQTFMQEGAFSLKSDACVFYVGYLHVAADTYAQANGKVIVNDVYYQPGHDKDPFDETKDPFKSYIAADKKRDWFGITSAAYADLCKGTAYFMWDGKTKLVGKTKDGKDWTSIWLSHELPQLRGKRDPISNVKLLGSTSPYKQSSYPNWRVSGKDDISAETKHDTELKKRASGTTTVVAPTENKAEYPEGSAFFDEDGGWVPGTCSAFLLQAKEGVEILGNLYDAAMYKLPANVVKGSTAEKLVFNSTLPWEIDAGVGSSSSDPISFKYDTFSWTTDNDNCQVGDFTQQNGGTYRSILCTFDCTY